MSREIYYDISYDSSLVSDSYDSLIDLSATAVDVQRRVIVQREINRLQDQLQSYNRQILEFRDTIFAIAPGDSLASSVNTVSDTQTMTIGELRAAVEAAGELHVRLAAHTQAVLTHYVRTYRPSLEQLKESAKSSSMLLLTASAVMPVFEQASQHARAVAGKQFLQNYVNKVSGMLDQFQQQHPDYELPAEVLQLASDMLSAQNNAQAMNIFDQLEPKLQLAVKDANRIAKRKEVIAHQERMKHEFEMVGALIVDAMKERGAEVSGIEESCFIQDGEIYAKLPAHPNNSARFTIDRMHGNRLKSELIRDDGFHQSDAVKQQEDKAWHDTWCSPKGLGRFRQSLAGKNVAITLTESTEYDVSVPIESVAKEEMPESFRNRTAYEDALIKRQQSAPKRQRER